MIKLSNMNNSKNIAIVGAGISGLSCAYELQKAGHNVTVYEKENCVGGRMTSRQKDGFTYDTGAEHLIQLYSHMHKYCTELGIEWEDMRFQKYNVFRSGKLFPMLDVISKLSRLRLAIQFFLTPTKNLDFFNLSTYVKYDTNSAFDTMRKKLGLESVHYLVDPFATTYQFHSAKEISLGLSLAALGSIKKHKNLWAMTRTKGGMEALPKALASKLKVHLNTPVISVENTNNQIQINFTNQKQETFDIVVLACTANIANKILKNPSPKQKKILESTTYATTISTSFKIPLSVAPKESTTFWVPFQENKTVSGYVNQLYKGKELVHKNETLISCWLHEDYAKKIINKTDKEIFTLIAHELSKVCPWLNSVKQLKPHDLQRWPEAMPKFSYGHLTLVKEFLDNGQGQNNIFLSGDYLNAPWLEGALRCGQRVAKQIIGSIF